VDYSRKETKAWAKSNVKGFYEAPLTPYTKDGQIDEVGIRSNVEAFIEMGVDGLVIGGYAAEAWNLTLSDWFRYHEIYVDAVKGRVDLGTIVLDPSVHQCLEKLEFCEKLGLNSAEVMNPSVQLKTDDEIYNFYKYLTDHNDMAIVLYRTPISGTVLSMDVMKRLADLDTMVGVKQSSLSRGDTLKLRRDIRDDFSIYEPWECFWYDDLKMGYPLISWAGLSYILYGKRRGELREYEKLALEGKWEESWKVFQGLRAIYKLWDDTIAQYIARTGSYASGLTILKPWFDAIGLEGGHVLAPVTDPDEAAREKLTGELRELGIC
jgi:4-hydroxy-tetrahydrodipicolinate synthase